MNKQLISILLGITLFYKGCTTNTSTFSQYISKQRNIQLLVKQGRTHWEQRVDVKNARTARLFLSKANALNPDDQTVAELYARACHFIGYYIEDDPTRSDSLFIEGMDTAWEFIISTDAYQEGVALSEGDSNAKKIAGLENTSQDMVPMLYWWVSNYSKYLLTKPVMERLQQRDIIETVLHRILALQPDFFYHGANRIFGGIYARLPGVDLNHSVTNFDKSIQGSPNYMGTYVIRAKYLYTKSGNREAFVNDLQKVLNADPTILPEVSPENLFEQEKARSLLAEVSSLFE